MGIALAVAVTIVLGNALIFAFLHGSALMRAQCPRCLGRDTTTLDRDFELCCECGFEFPAACGSPKLVA